MTSFTQNSCRKSKGKKNPEGFENNMFIYKIPENGQDHRSMKPNMVKHQKPAHRSLIYDRGHITHESGNEKVSIMLGQAGCSGPTL